MLKIFNKNNLFIAFSLFFVSSAFYSFNYRLILMKWVIPFSLIPLFIVSEKIAKSKIDSNAYRFCEEGNNKNRICKKLFYCFWFFGFVFHMIIFFWISTPFIYFGSVYAPLAYCVFIFSAVLFSLYYPILFSPVIFSYWFNTKYPQKKLFIFPIACLMALLEIYTPRFFNWSFGSLLHSNLIWNQINSLFGFNTGSLFIFYISLTLSSYKNKKQLVLPLLILLFVTLFGMTRIHFLNEELEKSQKFRVGFVQPNFTFNSLANLPLPSKKSLEKDFYTMLKMSSEVILKSIHFDNKIPDLIAWPESTAPDYFFVTLKQILKVQELSKVFNTSFLIETFENKMVRNNTNELKNYSWSSSAIVNSSGLNYPLFKKWQPMPFGEYVPLENKLPILGKWYRIFFKNASDKLEVGTSTEALYIKNNIYLTPLICFDAIDQEHSYLSVKKGKSNFFINQANFVWMLESNAGFELSILDQMRAIENGRSVVVASNSGPSMAFDPLGRLLLPPTQLLSQNFNFVDIPLYKGKTLFQIVYYWPLVILGILSFLYLIFELILIRVC